MASNGTTVGEGRIWKHLKEVVVTSPKVSLLEGLTKSNSESDSWRHGWYL